MNIFVNAVALKVAGGRSVLSNFINAVSVNSQGHTYYFFIPDDPIYHKYRNIPHIKLTPIPSLLNKPYFRYLIDHVYLPNKIRRLKPEVIFSMGNIALPVIRIPQVLLYHFPHLLYPESDYWNRIGLKKKYFDFLNNQISSKFRYATVIAAQTNAAKERLKALFKVKNVAVVPNAVSLHNMNNAPLEPLSEYLGELACRLEGAYVFLCLSRYYEHKNIEVLVDVAVRIKESGKNFKILITIDENQGKGAQKILQRIRNMEIEDVIINAGVIKNEDLRAIYHISHALIMPTLLESFSGTYIEAAYFKKPVFTSHFDFAKEILQENAVYFDPLNIDSIVDSLDMIKDTTFINRICESAYRRVQEYPTWERVAESYVKLIENTSLNYVH